MDKMKMGTANKTLENLAKLKEMFPEVITESKDENGEIVAAVDAKKLEQLLSTKVIEGDECYDFTWVGKKQAMVEACKPIRKTLRPCCEESVDWENTQNLYIEGDNLDVLKLLQESYLNKVKMIYIDPPYNTGNDSFIYPDDYATNKDLYDEEVGAIDESGYRMFHNVETNGRFHSSWCSMMYPRLKLAKNLLSKDGVIFMSIDDHEVDNLKKICDEIFGENNFVGIFKWNKVAKAPSLSSLIRNKYEYILCYQTGNVKQLCGKKSYNTEGPVWHNPNKPKELCFREKSIRIKTSFKKGTKSEKYNVELLDDLIEENGLNKFPVRIIASSAWGQEKINQYISSGKTFEFKKNIGTLYADLDSENNFISPSDIISKTECEVDNNTDASENLKKLGIPFSNPKPVSLIKYLLNTVQSEEEMIVLDFFSGAATTAHAVMQLNAEDGGKRKFIMVQLPEVCDEKSDAFNRGFKTICEIGKERIRRAGKKIVEETGKTDLDIGFRVLKLDESNMKDVYFAPEEYKQTDLVDMVSNIKEGRTAEDLLYACMLEWGLELSLPHKVQKIAGFDVHIVNNGDLVACFDDKVSEEALKQIAEMKPLRAVFRDSSFATDAARVNVGEIFKLKSPNTTIKVL